ncbi:hypothetical protein AVEN_174893-1, partial [Araneus ventricosus]
VTYKKLNVADLQKIVFSQRSLSEKLNIKNVGRIILDLNIVQKPYTSENSFSTSCFGADEPPLTSASYSV